jgi:hypothetical protein
MKLVLIHPLNCTYPIATIAVGDTIFNYSMFYDHDICDGKLGNLKIFDNTSYPETLDPTTLYSEKDRQYSYEILGLRDD